MQWAYPIPGNLRWRFDKDRPVQTRKAGPALRMIRKRAIRQFGIGGTDRRAEERRPEKGSNAGNSDCAKT